ncbi:hypothetical protein ES703_108416 [subsurface metagenome]
MLTSISSFEKSLGAVKLTSSGYGLKPINLFLKKSLGISSKSCLGLYNPWLLLSLQIPDMYLFILLRSASFIGSPKNNPVHFLPGNIFFTVFLKSSKVKPSIIPWSNAGFCLSLLSGMSSLKKSFFHRCT